MDLSIRDWMLVIGVLLILAVLLDGYRRVRKDRVRKVRMSLKAVPGAGEEEQPLTRGELPNGGARVASRGHGGMQHPLEPTLGDDWQGDGVDFRVSAKADPFAAHFAAEMKSTAIADSPVADSSIVDADQVDSDRVDFGYVDSASVDSDNAELPDVDAVKSRFAAPVRSDVVHEPVVPPQAPVSPSLRAASQPTPNRPVRSQSAASQGVSAAAPPEKARPEKAWPEASAADAFDAEPMTADAGVQEPRIATESVREIIVVNAVSKDPLGFSGEELLHILLTCDLRFGKMNIFHRYEKSNAKGAVQFSVANSVEPGTFDLNNMRNFKTPGICLFLQLPGPQDAQKALEYMVETAQCIARNLNGELRDENRSALTAQTVEHFRSRIREFDRKRMARHA